ncbi:putative ABC transporter A family member 4 [Sclerotinia borealis F-4128]|uniref:Putative ABC transporter A family member 4 n=1 Tax=Sclerotinia borealis (strain F-4128) TaxID=1432307 RepID=W9CBZ8_SCLBF|nr:putative ABC transporter A family member 4 [Sclerotinia borealis F-4128]
MRNATAGESANDTPYVALAPLEDSGFDLEGMGYSTVSAVIGPAAAFEGAAQNDLYTSKVQDIFSTFSLGDYESTASKALASRATGDSISDIIDILKGDNGEPAFGIFAPTTGDATLLHQSSELGIAAKKISTAYRDMRHVPSNSEGDIMNILLVTLLTIGFVCSTSISIMYPTFERINNLRALQYSNSVSYIIIQSGVHPFEQYGYVMLHLFFGIFDPASNLLRAFFIAKNNFGVTCSIGGDEVQSPYIFDLYGGVYASFILQIAFLSPLSMSPKLADIRAKGFDSKSASLPVLIVEKLTKYFVKLFAVDEVSFNICPNETLAFLGANGAGKTTTITCEDRTNLGVFPQDDAVDELTVRQTLDFFAAMKGLKNVKLNVDNILRAFNISEFNNVLVTKLSGGTRRKLMVAIALLGNPKVRLLDEPSTGQDAGAKRVLWKVLESFGRDRAISLTTHSMEEVQALASRVAIIGTKTLASGTLPELQNRYGGSYQVRAKYASGTVESDIRILLERTFGESLRNLKIGYVEANFELRHVTRNLGKIMQKMEGLMELKTGGIMGQVSGEWSGRPEGSSGGA